jgi:hypothetical protein
VTRPLLIPGLPRVWRTPDELQFGADPSRAVSLQLPDPRAAQVLDLLDGTRSERAVLDRAGELDIPLDHVRALIATLRTAGLIRPATDLLPSGLPHETRRRLLGEAAGLALAALPTGRRRTLHDRTMSAPADILRRRWHSHVVINGHGRLAAPIAVAVAEAGVGRVRAETPGLVGPGELPGSPLGSADLGRPRHAAITDAVLRAAPGGRVAAVRRPAATLVVQLDHEDPAVVPPTARPHLAVTIREGIPVIGPLVPEVGGPCLRCVDLHRKDRDAAWPGPAPRHSSEPIEPCTVALVLAATAYATAEVLAHLDGGRPQTLGAAVEITAPGRVRRRSWPPHPACRCAEGAPADDRGAGKRTGTPERRTTG